MVIDMSQLLSDLRCLKYKEFRKKYLGVLPPHFLISNALSNLKEHGGFEQAIDKSFEVRAFPALEGIYLFQQGDEYEVCSIERGGKGIPRKFKSLEDAVRCKIEWILNNDLEITSPDSILFPPKK